VQLVPELTRLVAEALGAAVAVQDGRLVAAGQSVVTLEAAHARIMPAGCDIET
jgi:hypothetical protein